jgi:hypothetical protein
MQALVKQFIEFCPCCQKISKLLPTIQATPFTMATYRFGERFDIDTIGALPKVDNENEYVVVIVDAFSRFAKLTPVKSTSGLISQSILSAHSHARASFIWFTSLMKKRNSFMT